jgi:hypothetical protein
MSELCHNLRLLFRVARVVKLVDAGDSKSPTERCAGSIPAPGTIIYSYFSCSVFRECSAQRSANLQKKAPDLPARGL